MFLHLFALRISEGALDAMFRRAKPCFDDEVAVILARLRRSRIVCSDETTVQGHADLWQVCLAHQLRDCTFAIEAGDAIDAIFAPRMKALLCGRLCWPVAGQPS